MKEAVKKLPLLEESCPACDGSGRFRREECEVCSGRGYIPTELGERVLKLMRHNFKPMLKEQMR